MLLLELAVQSVRGFSPSIRVALKPGLVVLKSPADTPAPVASLISSLCYPDGKGLDVSFVAQGQKSGKAGVSFQAADHGVWRLVKQLGGQGSLHKLNIATRQYEVVTQDAQEMQSTLRSQIGLPPRATFESLFTLTPAHFPTRRGSGKTDKVKKKAGGGGAEPAADGSKLEGLRQELMKAKQASELQYRLDGIQSDLFGLESKQRAVDELRAQVEAAKAELTSAPTPERLGLPPDIAERIGRFDEEKEKHTKAVRRVMDERDEAAAAASVPKDVPPLSSDPRFWGALAGGLLLLVVGGMSAGAAHYAALLAIAPFSFAALLALRFIEELQGQSRKGGGKTDLFQLRIDKLEAEFAAIDKQVTKALEAFGASNRDDFVAALQRPAMIQARIAELEAKHAHASQDPENAGLPPRIAQLRAEIDALNQRMLEEGGAQGYGRSELDIQKEIQRIEESLERAKNPEEAFGLANTPAEQHEDPTPALMVMACDLFHLDTPTLWAQLRDRTVQYLTALADRRYHGADIEKDGRAFVQAPGRKVPVSELAGKDLDLWYLALRLTIAEKYSARARVPVVIEDGLQGIIDEPKLVLLSRMLKHLSTLTQVVHVVGAKRSAPADEGQTFTV